VNIPASPVSVLSDGSIQTWLLVGSLVFMCAGLVFGLGGGNQAARTLAWVACGAGVITGVVVVVTAMSQMGAWRADVQDSVAEAYGVTVAEDSVRGLVRGYDTLVTTDEGASLVVVLKEAGGTSVLFDSGLRELQRLDADKN